MTLFARTLILLFSVASAVHAQRPHVAATKPLPPDLQRKAMHLPAGFEIQLVAAEPDIINPMNIAFGIEGNIHRIDEYCLRCQRPFVGDAIG